MNKQGILDFIKKHKLAVISTVSPDNKPESAVIEFGETDRLELVFDTYSTSRKYENLKKNKYAAFVIGWDEDVTVQYEGIAQELRKDDGPVYKKAFFAKNPEAKRWDKRDGIVYFKVIPVWIRYSDLRKYPWETFELKDF